VHLRSITLKGFKSFPDRTRLEFSPGVSVIVGPNGSGKSNVTDAVLWALGEQSPLAVRGASMQDVIFAGGHGVQARSEAEVEVVIDNGDGAVDLPLSEISIARRLDRAGEGEYRVNGTRCRLADVAEILSDTGLGKEMHSVVSQGRIEAIVTSKPKDRRLLIEEAAGLGKHRKRRRRAQLKLDRTQDNLDRALDVEREARSRLRPLKRQADAAELHERLERQILEARWGLARDASRASGMALAAAATAAKEARAAAAACEAELAAVAARRETTEVALAARGSEREALSARFYGARSAADRVETRLEAARSSVALVADRALKRRALVEALDRELDFDAPDEGADERIAELEVELEQLAAGRAERLARELAGLEAARDSAAARAGGLAEAAAVGVAARRESEAGCEAARAARRAAEADADRARREAARTGAELAALNHYLRSHAGAPGGAPSLADSLTADAGFELALAAVLGPRLRAALADDLTDAVTLVGRAGKDGGAALIPARATGRVDGGDRRCAAPVGAVALLDHVRTGDDRVSALATALLGEAYVVDDISVEVDPSFAGMLVTREGLVWSPSTGELRRVPAGGEDRVLAKRNERDALVARTGEAARLEQAAIAAVELAAAAVAAADAARDEADRSAREATRAHTDALDAEQRAVQAIAQRRRSPDDEATATRRAQVGAALAAERRLLERAAREREQRAQRIAAERSRAAADEQLLPAVERLAAVLELALEAVGEQMAARAAELEAERTAGDRLAAELRECAQAEAEVQAKLKARAEDVTRAEVRAQQARDQAAEAGQELVALADALGLEAQAADTELGDEERRDSTIRIERLQRRREQLGPVNALAQSEYAEAIAHVEELEAQREDLDAALRELRGIIRDTDRRIREAFEETFTAAARNFEDVVGELFPGGRGRLRLVKEDAGPRAVLGGSPADDDGDAAMASAEELVEAAAEAEESRDADPAEGMGVEIEITPAGKSTKRLSLLSGGEKSLTALAFLFAVFLAKPCPFYILDEVEAALDDLNIDRFLTVLRKYSDRAQFIVVTHQKRTMEAADCLYGVSMAGNGVSKVVSRRLPRAADAA